MERNSLCCVTLLLMKESKVHVYLHCVRLLGMLEVNDAEEQGILCIVKQHQGGALDSQ